MIIRFRVFLLAAVIGLAAAGITACGSGDKGRDKVQAEETTAGRESIDAGEAGSPQGEGTDTRGTAEDEGDANSPAEDKADADGQEAPGGAAEEPLPETEEELIGGIPVQIFYGDDNAEYILSKEAFVADVNQEELVRCLREAGVLEEGTQVLSLERREEKKGIYLDVDFNEKFTEKLNRMGTSGERIYMGSVVNTFLTAFEADFMMVTAEGETIESGHVIYDEYQGPYEKSAETVF